MFAQENVTRVLRGKKNKWKGTPRQLSNQNLKKYFPRPKETEHWIDHSSDLPENETFTFIYIESCGWYESKKARKNEKQYSQ